MGHYEIIELVGRGGFGIVFKAFDEELQRVSALKVLAPELASSPESRKRFIREAHKLGIAVLIDVVYNHFGPSDLNLWQFDGWSENGKGGIYFYNDHRSQTPWGETRPDYGREEVRQYFS